MTLLADTILRLSTNGQGVLKRQKKVNFLEQDSLEKVLVFKEQALCGKGQAKRRTQEKVLKLLDHHKRHEGQVTKTCIHILEYLTLKDVQIETCHLNN